MTSMPDTYQGESIALDPRVNILSVDVECWDQILCRRLTGRLQHPSEKVVEATTYLLDLFRRSNATATFFVLGYVAEAFPDLVRRMIEEGHEVASHGWSHTHLGRLTRDQVREEVERSRDLLGKITGRDVAGFRAPEFSITEDTCWALDILIDCGFTYDSSIFPIRAPRYGIPWFPREAVRLHSGTRSIVEVPLSVLPVRNLNFPVSGGGYFRLLPYRLIREAVRRVQRSGRPFVVYLHPYDFLSSPLDTGVCGLPSKSFAARWIEFKSGLFRSRMPVRLGRLLEEFRFASFREVLSDVIP